MTDDITAKPTARELRTVTRTNKAVARLERAWAPVKDLGADWPPRPWVPISQRAQVGRDTRQRVPRTSHAAETAFAYYQGAPGRDGGRPGSKGTDRTHRPGQRRRAGRTRRAS